MAQFHALAKEYKTEQETLNYRSAQICSVIANAPYKKRDFKPKDFMPKKEKPKVQLTGEQMKGQLEMINAALGGEVK